MKYWLYFLMGMACFSCARQNIPPRTNASGEVVRLEPIWQIPLHAAGKTSNSVIDAHLVHDQKVIIATTTGANQRALSCVDVEDGTRLWEWQDAFEGPEAYYDIRDAYLFDEVLYYNHGSRHYGISLADGQTVRKSTGHSCCQTYMSATGDQLFSNGPVSDTLAGFQSNALYQIDLASGRVSQRLVPYFSQEHIAAGNRIGDVTGFVPFDEKILVVYQEPASTYAWRSFLGVFDLTSQKWVYERMPINEAATDGVLFHKPVIHDQKIYAIVGNTVYHRSRWPDRRRRHHRRERPHRRARRNPAAEPAHQL
ncbi:MAG: hypothetical protein AAF206_31875, partial [Bacteroidota bacterium]